MFGRKKRKAREARLLTIEWAIDHDLRPRVRVIEGRFTPEGDLRPRLRPSFTPMPDFISKPYLPDFSKPPMPPEVIEMMTALEAMTKWHESKFDWELILRKVITEIKSHYQRETE